MTQLIFHPSSRLQNCFFFLASCLVRKTLMVRSPYVFFISSYFIIPDFILVCGYCILYCNAVIKEPVTLLHTILFTIDMCDNEVSNELRERITNCIARFNFRKYASAAKKKFRWIHNTIRKIENIHLHFLVVFNCMQQVRHFHLSLSNLRAQMNRNVCDCVFAEFSLIKSSRESFGRISVCTCFLHDINAISANCHSETTLILN